MTRAPGIAGLAESLFTHLRRMDEEATTVRDGSPTGLSWYGGHSRPDLKKPHTEVEWSKRLAELLIGLHADDDPMDEDVAQLVDLAELHAPVWTSYSTDWPDAHRDGRRVSCWFWHRRF